MPPPTSPFRPLTPTIAALGLMLTVPFLMAHHFHPITAFYQEWTAALIGLCTVGFVLLRSPADKIEIPRLGLVPLGLIGVALAQWLILPGVQGARLQLFALYLAWTFLILILGRRLTTVTGFGPLSHTVATFILAGALLQALSAALQLGGSLGLPWIFPHTPGIAVRGNLAQNNSFGNYLWLGIVAAIHLRGLGRLKAGVAGAAIATLVVFAVLSGSRSTWLYAASIAMLAGLIAWQRPQDIYFRHVRRWATAAFSGAIIFQLLISSGLLSELLTSNGMSAGARLFETRGHDPIRKALWYAALLTWLDHPLLGGGIGQYTWHVHQRVLELMPVRLPGLPEHAHNLLLHLLAETGLAGTIIVIAGGVDWLRQFVRQIWTAAHWYIAASLLILILHSGLEYPLWYTFFLGPFALMIGAASDRVITFSHDGRLRLAIGIALMIGLTMLYYLRADYSLLEDTVNSRIAVTNEADAERQHQQTVHQLSGTLFISYLELMIVGRQVADTNGLDQKLVNCERAMRFSATRAIVFKCVHLQALAGQDDMALLALKRAVASYPDEAEMILPQWRQAATRDDALAWLVRNFPPIVPAAVR